MGLSKFKTFWEIEKEKTWRIYIVFGFLVLLYFITIFLIWLLIKVSIHLRPAIISHEPFRLFDKDLLIVFTIAVIIAVTHWYYSNATVVNRILQLLRARPPDKHDKYHYTFENIVDEIETAAGGLPVERYVLPTGAMNAFALADLKGRKVIGVTEGSVSRLSREELQSVVAHEMAHIISNDCLLITIICSLFNIYSETLAQFSKSLSRGEPLSFLAEARPRQAVNVVSFPILMLLFVVEILSQLLYVFISREREYRADASAIKLTRDPLSLARALYKIGTHWRGAGYGGEYLSPVFILSPELNQLEESESFYANLFSTHPPLINRLQIVCDLAHADIAQITEHLQKSKKVKTTTESIQPLPKFFVEINNKFFGPFTILQLQTIDGLKPDSRIRMEGCTEIISAVEIPALSHYFILKSEPMWRIHRICPMCRQWLVIQEYEGLYLWRCAFCNGILVEKDKLPRIFARKEKGFSEEVQRIANLLKEDAKRRHPHQKLLIRTMLPRFCPRCGKPMVRRLYSYAYRVEIDECPNCKLMWFDADELEILQCLIEQEELTQ